MTEVTLCLRQYRRPVIDIAKSYNDALVKRPAPARRRRLRVTDILMQYQRLVVFLTRARYSGADRLGSTQQLSSNVGLFPLSPGFERLAHPTVAAFPTAAWV